MTFYNTDLQYRVTLDTKLNLFIVFDKKDANHFARTFGSERLPARPPGR
jgi:hypothetical protein